MINNGNMVKDVIKININEIIIIFPNSIIGFMSEKSKDPKATIVVKEVYKQGQKIFLIVNINLFCIFLSK